MSRRHETARLVAAYAYRRPGPWLLATGAAGLCVGALATTAGWAGWRAGTAVLGLLGPE